MNRHISRGRGSTANFDSIGAVKRLIYNHEAAAHEERIAAPKFIKGPIPAKWMATANGLPGKAGAVGLALWFLRGVKQSMTVPMNREALQLAACRRAALYGALDALERAGLIRQHKQPGRRTQITLLVNEPQARS